LLSEFGRRTTPYDEDQYNNCGNHLAIQLDGHYVPLAATTDQWVAEDVTYIGAFVN